MKIKCGCRYFVINTVKHKIFDTQGSNKENLIPGKEFATLEMLSKRHMLSN